MIKLMKSPLGEDEIKIVQEDHQDINQIEQLNPRHLLERSNKILPSTNRKVAWTANNS